LSKKKHITSKESKHVLKVQEFYNSYNDKFLKVYGDIIQAFRTNNVEDILNDQVLAMRIQDGMKLLDAGCGVCGPAIYFAKKLDIKIEACSISDVQVELARKKIHDYHLSEKINVQLADYHQLASIYPENHFDRIYFLESFGHSDDKKTLISGVWNCMAPGGMVYIKDLFRRESENDWVQLRIDHICNQIDDAYAYRISDLGEILSILRRKGFILHYVKIPEVKISDFEKLTISNDFQNLFDVGKIDSWEDYVFPIDFYEILAEKPIGNSAKDMHLYHLNKNI
jgi:cyclopropane fatty-acyl-phospholipid synthase-like methyltransferase